jgi:hypothetical protein
MLLKYTLSLLIALISLNFLWAQREDIVLQKERKEFAYQSIKELKEGALVVRLKTNHRKIQLLENTLKSSSLKKNQRKRHQAMLDGTIKTRDDFNKAIADIFMDSFSFCSVYLMHDTSTNSLKKGIKSGIFLDSNQVVDPSIKLIESTIFIINYKKKSSEFPFDVLRMQKLKERLDDPFPYYMQLRESWLNQINSPRAAQAVVQLDRKLSGFYSRALFYDQKKAEKAAIKKTKKEKEVDP